MPFDPSGFREAVDESKTDEAPPDAIYETELVESQIITRRSDGAQWAKFAWKVVAGPQRDSRWESLHTLERFKPDGERNPGLVFTVQALRAMGLDVDNTPYNSDRELEDALRTLEGKGYTVEVKRSGGFVNTYPKGVLETYAPSLPGSGGDTPAYGQQRAAPANAIMGRDDGGTSAPPQTLGQAGAPITRDVERDPNVSDVTTPTDVEAFTTREPVQKGDIDPETGQPIPF
jgi:hypothetical protein